jgi:hypothetical protein
LFLSADPQVYEGDRHVTVRCLAVAVVGRPNWEISDGVKGQLFAVALWLMVVGRHVASFLHWGALGAGFFVGHDNSPFVFM